MGPERRRHACRAPRGGLDREPHRLRRRGRRGVHERWHAIQPSGPPDRPRAGIPLRRCRPGRTPGADSRPIPDLRVARQPLQCAEVGERARPRPRCRGDDPHRRPPPDGPVAARRRDCPGAGCRPDPHGCRRNCGHDRLRQYRSAGAGGRHLRRAWRVDARRCCVRGRAARIDATPAPHRRHPARGLGHDRLPQDVLPAGQLQRRHRAPWRRPEARDVPRGLPQSALCGAAEPGRQEPADHAPVRCAQAVADAAHDGRRCDR